MNDEKHWGLLCITIRILPLFFEKCSFESKYILLTSLLKLLTEITTLSPYYVRPSNISVTLSHVNITSAFFNNVLLTWTYCRKQVHENYYF